MPANPAVAEPGAGSATRLLILGCVRIFEPVHGYFLRRELLSWRIDEWANVHPGSIYNALRSLKKAGLLDEVTVQATLSTRKRTAFALTAAGEGEYLALLRDSLATTSDPVLFLVAINFAPFLPRAEVLALLGRRVELLSSWLDEGEQRIAAMLASGGSPPSATETTRVINARRAGELAWAKDYLERVSHGAYAFAGEPPDWSPSPDSIAEAVRGGAGSRGARSPWYSSIEPRIAVDEG